MNTALEIWAQSAQCFGEKDVMIQCMYVADQNEWLWMKAKIQFDL